MTAGKVSCGNWAVCLVVALKVDKTRHTFMQVRAAAAAGARLDGRGFLELPPIEVATGVASQALGSAHVVMGDTEVLVGVKVCFISLGVPCSGQCASRCNPFQTQVGWFKLINYEFHEVRSQQFLMKSVVLLAGRCCRQPHCACKRVPCLQRHRVH